MAEKKQTIVIKKIIVSGGGGHGGSWKVALADFMTALMAFFLVMWLLGQSEETKKAVSDYFSTPSVIEYNFQNFGAEITLEKLFLDILNEPLKAFQSFMEPVEKSPNLLDMGSVKVVQAFLADQLQDFSKSVQVTADGFDISILDSELFERGTAVPNANFVKVMDKIKGITSGLKDANIQITAGIVVQSTPDNSAMSAQKAAAERLDIVRNKVLASLDDTTVTVKGSSGVKNVPGEVDPKKLLATVTFSIRQKEITADGKKPRKLENLFGPSQVDMSGYNSYVKKISGAKKPSDPGKNLKEQIDTELKEETGITDPSTPTE